MMEQDKLIIYIALSNQILFYEQFLQMEKDISEQDLELAQNIIKRSIELLDQFEPESPDLEIPISRPTF